MNNNTNHIIFNNNHKFIKLYLRVIKELNLYKDVNYKSTERFYETIDKYTLFNEQNITEKTLNYIFDIPNTFMTLQVPWNEYRKVYREYLIKIMPIITPLIIKHIYTKYIIIKKNDKNIDDVINDVIEETKQTLYTNTYMFPITIYKKTIENVLIKNISIKKYNFYKTSEYTTHEYNTNITARFIETNINNITINNVYDE